jgi:adenine/guanine phosphoribosyltransferase-like PRPP-binding protein
VPPEVPEPRLVLLVAGQALTERETDVIYHGETGLADIALTVRAAVMDIGPYRQRFDFIAVTGMSGVLIGAPVAIALDIPLVVVRKKGDTSHSWRPLINGTDADGKYLFLDDFISVGNTFRRLVNVLSAHDSNPEYAGCYLYEHRQMSWDGDGIIAYAHLHDPAKWCVSVSPLAEHDPELHLADAA